MMMGVNSIFSPFRTVRFSASGLTLVFALGGQPALAQTIPADDSAQARAAVEGEIAHAQKMRSFKDADIGSQPTPGTIPRFEIDSDPSGQIASFQPGGPTTTALNAFFQNLGTNGRTCFSCHQPQTGWTVSAASVEERFKASGGKDPIFRLVDGATCPSDDVSTPAAKIHAYRLLTGKGLIRIGLLLPDPSSLQFEVTSVANDPDNCNTNPTTGLMSPTSGTVSIYRRPLPSTNADFLATIMWDGRELSPAKVGLSNGLSQQAIDATRIHAQADPPGPTAAQQAQIVAFQEGHFTAQEFNNAAGNLHAENGLGGPVALSSEVPEFFFGINDPLGTNPTGAAFDPNIFNLYKFWESLQYTDADKTEARKSIARGEQVFNTTNINITGVSGLNDDLNKPSLPGFCGTCHDTFNVGNHSVSLPLDIGIADAGPNAPPALDISSLPVFTLTCTAEGPLKGKKYVVTDPGRALITGQCKDIGRLKGPILRGLASRAPYFHNGSAATLMDVVNFYNQRFNLNFTDQQKQDLVNFLNTL
jgi:cytochrome c peroxidase